ncbi:MAG: GTPase HflX [Clostridia bacterium]|nr:GTPase HflX [Clostridia bacterium]
MLYENKEIIERAILCGVHTGAIDVLSDTTEETISELERLADTAGAETVGFMIQNKSQIEKATYIGEGKIEELKNACGELEANLVIFDDELSPMQIRNLEDRLNVRVIDRSMLILDIFARHAVTGEGKIQVELAQLKYLLPRLTGMGSKLSRLGGGVGTRGPGETKLETDRRHIYRRIDHLKEELREVKKHRELLRLRRKKENRYMVAIVGYTNAGKSTLLNHLTGADVLAQDKLFATLDPTIRGLTLSDKREIMLVDTVGFIRKLPHHLVEAFKSTLEEAVYADLLLIVADGADSEVDMHLEIVSRLLSDIGAADKPKMVVFNKSDLIPEDKNLTVLSGGAPFVEISAKTGTGIDKLLALLEDLVPGKKKKITLLIPYAMGHIVSELHSNQTILDESYEADGTRITALLDAVSYGKYRDYILEEHNE